MSVSKPLPIAAAIAGLLAAIGISVKLATNTNPSEAHVDALLGHEKEAALSDPLENLDSRLNELTDVRHETGFAKLPPSKKEAVDQKITELRDLASYRLFEAEMNGIPDPKIAKSESQLMQIEERLKGVEIPRRIPDAFKESDAIRRREEWLQDARDLQCALMTMEEAYDNLISEAKKVLATKNDPNLPDRIQAVLALEKRLSASEKPAFGSQRVTYAIVFQFAEIESKRQEWKKLKEKLEPAAKSKSPE
jgi:hypothetical protein